MKPDDTKQQKQAPPDAPPYPCVCATIRKAGRIVTRQYDQYLKPSGLKITQFSVLANISRNPGITVSKLADLLITDQTTMTRVLRGLENAGYILLQPGVKDRRVKRVQITDAGLAKLNEARPLWAVAQREMEQTLGRGGIEDLLDWVRKLAG